MAIYLDKKKAWSSNLKLKMWKMKQTYTKKKSTALAVFEGKKIKSGGA